MIEKILHLAPTLTHLEFVDFFHYSDKSEETKKYGKRLLHAISSIREPTLISLNLGQNSILWKDEMIFVLLLDVL